MLTEESVSRSPTSYTMARATSAYDESSKSWLAMEAMKIRRSLSLVASLHDVDNTMLVIVYRRLE